MAFKNKDWKIISNRILKEKQIKSKDSIVDNSFYFLWPRSMNFPLYVWYIIEDYWPKILVWILRRDNWKQTECTIKKSIITYDLKNDYKEERNYYCANLSSATL